MWAPVHRGEILLLMSLVGLGCVKTSIDQRKIILFVFEHSGFSHSLGHEQTNRPLQSWKRKKLSIKFDLVGIASAQREKHRAVIELLARIRQILSFLQDGQIAPDMIDSDIALCKSLEEKLRAKGSW
jgi:hypothetical protein